MMDIRNLITQSDYLTFQGMRCAGCPVIQHPVSYFPGQIQSLPVLFQPFHHPNTLLKMCKSFRADFIQSRFTGMSERCMPQIMPQRNCFHQILIQLQRLRDRPRRL